MSYDRHTVFLTYGDVAKRLRVKVKTVRNWVSAGTFPEPIPIGGGVKRFTEEQLADHIVTSEIVGGLSSGPSHKRKDK